MVTLFYWVSIMVEDKGSRLERWVGSTLHTSLRTCNTQNSKLGTVEAEAEASLPLLNS